MGRGLLRNNDIKFHCKGSKTFKISAGNESVTYRMTDAQTGIKKKRLHFIYKPRFACIKCTIPWWQIYRRASTRKRLFERFITATLVRRCIIFFFFLRSLSFFGNSLNLSRFFYIQIWILLWYESFLFFLKRLLSFSILLSIKNTKWVRFMLWRECLFNKCALCTN